MEEPGSVGALLSSSSWLLPNAAWEVVAHHLAREDLLAARLACRMWRKDLGACITQATAFPSQLLLPPPPGLSTHSSPGQEPADETATAAVGVGNGSVGGTEEAAGALAAAEAAAEGALQLQQESADKAECNSGYAECGSSSRAVQQQRLSALGSVRSLLDAFPHCDMVFVDVSTHEERQLAAAVINALAASSASANSSSIGGSSCVTGDPRAGTDAAEAAAAAAAAAAGVGSNSASCTAAMKQISSGSISSEPACSSAAAAAANEQGIAEVLPLSKSSPPCCRLRLCLDALQRSYHCPANQEYPSSGGRGVFGFLGSLPRQLSPAGLAALVSVQLDAFPDAPVQWAVLQRLPCLRKLLLPSFRPALPYEHLPALARLTQLEALTVSVQGSITAWRANCAAFASLGALSRLQQLSVHAFHCPGAHLASALVRLMGLAELRLSGRVVLEPLTELSRLTRLQVLELTQDVQYATLCDLVRDMSALTQLAVGRVTLPPAPPLASSAAAPGPALTAAAAGDDADMPHLGAGGAAPAADGAAGAVVVAADDGGAVAVAAAAGADGGAGEVMLEDVGAIVDGLVGNLQEGAVPVHLQRIIERFESIIQLDLTRRSNCTPWGWPVPGLALLEELNGAPGCQNTTAGTCSLEMGGAPGFQSVCEAGGGDSGRAGVSRRISSHVDSLELALLRPADVVRLHELPSQLRACSHLGLRLRDQLLAFASVCPVRLAAGQLAGLGAAFRQLGSLSLCGKVALDGGTLVELTQGLAALQPPPGTPAGACRSGSELCQDARQGAAAAAAGAGMYGVRAAVGTGLVCLSLDCHFVAVSSEHMEAALQQLQGLKGLSLRHRGAGKLPVPLSALPRSLTTLAVKKVLLYHQQCSSSTMHAQAQKKQQQQRVVLVPDCEPVLGCHAITSPGFRRAVACGISRPPSADLSSLPVLASKEAATDKPVAAAAAAAAGSAAGSAGGVGSSTVLPKLHSLFVKNCLAGSETLRLMLGLPVDSYSGSGGSTSNSSTGSSNSVGPSQLVRLSVTGDQATHGEVSQSWPEWVAAIRRLTSLQVLDIALPEGTDFSMPPELLQVLLALPRLTHLHITAYHAPLQLLGLTGLRGRLRTLNINYMGPPTLPCQLLAQLRSGLGPTCKVQVWENVVMLSSSSFGEVGGAGAGNGGGVAEVLGRVGPRSKGGRLRGVVRAAGWGVVIAGGWWCGWLLGSAVGGWQPKQRQPKQRQQQQHEEAVGC